MHKFQPTPDDATPHAEGGRAERRGLHVRRGDIRRAPSRGDSSTRPAAVVARLRALPPTTVTKPKPAPARAHRDEGVDTFGQPTETPPPEPDQPAPVVSRAV